MYFPRNENKGADQLRGYREADLRLCFRICKKPVFSQRGSNGIVLLKTSSVRNFVSSLPSGDTKTSKLDSKLSQSMVVGHNAFQSQYRLGLSHLKRIRTKPRQWNNHRAEEYSDQPRYLPYLISKQLITTEPLTGQLPTETDQSFHWANSAIL